MTKYIKADEFYYPYQVKKAGYLAIEGDTFGSWQAEVPSDAEIIDYTGYSIAPGLVDTHIHGFAGADFWKAAHSPVYPGKPGST